MEDVFWTGWTEYSSKLIGMGGWEPFFVLPKRERLLGFSLTDFVRYSYAEPPDLLLG